MSNAPTTRVGGWDLAQMTSASIVIAIEMGILRDRDLHVANRVLRDRLAAARAARRA